MSQVHVLEVVQLGEEYAVTLQVEGQEPDWDDVWLVDATTRRGWKTVSFALLGHEALTRGIHLAALEPIGHSSMPEPGMVLHPVPISSSPS